jgi:LuxR family transcriptional regulator, maltose regulon positive regulatory protein
MQTTILATKLFVPSARETLVARPRLTDVLSKALAQGFTLVSAPAGYGKTTLVSTWLRETGIPTAWLSLEEADNDPIRFLQYLLTALHDIVVSIHFDLLDLVEGGQPAALQALINILINEIAKTEDRFVLVLDDFHLIQDPSILDMITCLLDHLPTQQMHLVLITRTDPPLPLSRLRVCGQMTEIRAEQLRFTLAEIAAFLNGMMGFHLSAEDITAMEARTEGWIAGLQLAALSMQGCKDVSGFIAAFRGSHHYIVDYLADEVLKRQDEQTRQFLLQTSILSRMCAALCNRLMESETEAHPLDGQRMLETLEKRNLFIISLDEERRWYRYHHLFADALNRRLEHQYPEKLPHLNHRASLWYEENGLIADAIQYALSAGDAERAAQLVEGHGCYLLMSGEVRTLLKWMEAVEAYFPAHPWLVIQKGWALTLAGRMEPAEQVFQEAERLVSALVPPPPDIHSMVGTISAGRASWADIQGNIPEAARLAQQALDLLPDTDPLSQSMRSVATGTLAKTIWLNGDLERARHMYIHAAEMGRAANNAEMVINSNDDIAGILMEQGRLKQAEQLLLETLPMTVRADGQQLTLAAQVYSRLSKIYYEWNRFDQAAHYARLCLDAGQQWGNVELQAMGSVILALIEQASERCSDELRSEGSQEKAYALMRTADQLNQNNRFYPLNAIWVTATLDRFWLSLGSQKMVSQHLQAAGIIAADIGSASAYSTDDIPYLRESHYLTFLRWLLARGKFDAAQDLAKHMLQKAKADGRILRVVELLVLQSLAYQGMKDISAAEAALAEAVSLAQPEGYRRVFLDEGERVGKLLYLVKSKTEAAGAASRPSASLYAAGYARELLEAFGSDYGPVPVPAQLLIEPLSAREIEVLKLIEAGLSNQEIADKLYLSVATVKRHISNIYAKLDVETRTQALSRGKELGFFDR